MLEKSTLGKKTNVWAIYPVLSEFDLDRSLNDLLTEAASYLGSADKALKALNFGWRNTMQHKSAPKIVSISGMRKRLTEDVIRKLGAVNETEATEIGEIIAMSQELVTASDGKIRELYETAYPQGEAKEGESYVKAVGQEAKE